MTLILDGLPIDQATLDAAGTDLASAVAGRFSLETPEMQQLLRRFDSSSGWRETYDGPAAEHFGSPGEPLPRCLEFAAPAGAGWQCLTCLREPDGSFTTIWSPGPYQVEEE